MANLDYVAFMDATAQAELVRNKEVKPIELVEGAIQRIEDLNPTLNAVIYKLYEDARETAEGDIPDGPFTGVPFLLKDLLAAYAGAPLTNGCAFLKDFVPDHDSELVARFKRSGLITLGKTNTPEFGLTVTTEPTLFGPTRNPWDLGRTTGGSSGGSAAAVITGQVAMAHANDGGGSIRIPASCCGVFGLKPTRARNPLGPDYGDVITGLICEHVVTRSVRDSATMLDSLSGPEVGDPYAAPPPERPYAQEVGAEPGRLRIAFSTEAYTGVPVDPDCVAAVRDVAALCSQLGHEVEETVPDVSVDPDAYSQAFLSQWTGYTGWVIDTLAKVTGRTPTAEGFEPATWQIYERNRDEVSGADYLRGLHTLQQFTRDMGRFMVDYDAWLTPTMAKPPVHLGSIVGTPTDNPAGYLVPLGEFSPFTGLCNATGQPGMSIPLIWNSKGLPIGVHFAGRFGDEATLFRLAAQLEEARPWAHRRPPMLEQ